ncbi:MAG TPA: hypothetical protein VK206_19605 [Anaerolineales bacterium]|nr:hypothetical protein [Anaerolineales bacterium]
MPFIPVVNPLGYIGVFLVIAGFFLVIAGIELIKIEKLIIIAVATTIWGTAIEDQMLQDELPGYADYAAKVRYRLIPGVW